MSLTTEQHILVEQRVMNDAKSTGVAYLLWFFLGTMGGHRFYLGRTTSAVIMLLAFIIGWATVIFVVGVVLLIPLGIWALIDAFLIPGMVRQDKERLRNSLTMTMIQGRTA